MALKGTHWKHLTQTDRERIYKWTNEGMKPTEIARKLRVHRNTIYKELKRGMCIQQTKDYRFVEKYCPDVAERRYRANLAEKGPKEKIGNDRELADYLARLMREEGYSPAAAAAAARKDKEHHFSCTLSKGTMYHYIPKGIFWGVTNKELPRKGKKKRKYSRVRVGRAPTGESIERRPEQINSRQEPFHWEMDCVLGRKKTRACLLTLTERVTRFELIFRMEAHTMVNVVSTLDGIERRLGPEKFRELFKSITIDNGSEFADCAGMERSAVDGKRRTVCYYCHPYASWERGSNENQNSMIRRKLPKGTNFDEVDAEEVQKVQDWMNSYPRELLGWESAGERLHAITAA